MNKEIEEREIIIKDIFDDIPLKENEVKGILSIMFVKNNSTKEISISYLEDTNKIDIVEVIMLLLRDKKELEIQQIFEAVREFI